MRAFAADRVEWFVTVWQSDCLSVTTMSLAEMAELIEMPFGMCTWVAPRTMY